MTTPVVRLDPTADRTAIRARLADGVLTLPESQDPARQSSSIHVEGD